MLTITAADFNRRPSQVKRSAVEGPVVITERDHPSFVLMTYDEFQRLSGESLDSVKFLAMDDDQEIEFEPLNPGLCTARL